MAWLVNVENIRKGERYSILVILTWKKRATVKVYFNRKKIDVWSDEHFVNYLKKFYIYNR